MKAHLFVSAGGIVPVLPAGITGSILPSSCAAAASMIEHTLANGSLETVAFWDSRLGAVPWAELERFENSLDDAWHPGAIIGTCDDPDLLRYVQPLWMYRRAPDPSISGLVNWRLDLRATFIRANVLRNVGGLDARFDTLAGAGLDLGFRLIRGGAVCRQHPELIAEPSVAPVQPTLTDRYRLLRKGFSPKWASYALTRRLMSAPSVVHEIKAWNESATVTNASTMRTRRDLHAVSLPEQVSVSVVLPTFGRYRYLAEVLDDLRAQTIAPVQILIADGNPVGDRKPEVYEAYSDLPLEVIWHEEPGICSGRNACLRRATGDFVWFVDDDSRIGPDNLESHLRVLVAYGADVSVGPAYTRSRPDLHGEQREIVCTHMDCGTTLCRRAILDAVGGFDMQFNQYLVGEDGDLGIRFARAGGLMVNNPFAKRFHYLAPVGGSRSSKRSVHRFSRWSLLPRPVQSIYYTARRYFEPEVLPDAMFQASIQDGWRRREGVPLTYRWRAKTLLGEIFALPVTVARLYRSVQIGRDMVKQGPQVASISPTNP